MGYEYPVPSFLKPVNSQRHQWPLCAHDKSWDTTIHFVLPVSYGSTAKVHWRGHSKTIKILNLYNGWGNEWWVLINFVDFDINSSLLKANDEWLWLLENGSFKGLRVWLSIGPSFEVSIRLAQKVLIRGFLSLFFTFYFLWKVQKLQLVKIFTHP